MPLEFIELLKGFHQPTPNDRGFLLNMVRSKWTTNATAEALNMFKSFADAYYDYKCPEEKEESIEEDVKEETTEEADKETKTEGESTEGSKKKGKGELIQFTQRKMSGNTVYCFLACNLADPEDFAHYMFTKLATDPDVYKVKMAFRVFPVQRITEAKPKEAEQAFLPLAEEVFGSDMLAHRVSIIHRSFAGSESLPRNDVLRLTRNCVWASNPNCVQCLKYQDYAVILDTLQDMLYIGILREFQRLGSYNTWVIRKGIDTTDAGPDSEDDISDDPDLSEDEQKRQRLRIKRKRRAEKMGEEGDADKKEKQEEDDGDGDEEDKNGEEDNNGDDDNGVEEEENGDEDD